ncbi:MAG: response regulator [Pseudomonadales bacterium]|nr:response regulator [Pseudomonadales bacterium]
MNIQTRLEAAKILIVDDEKANISLLEQILLTAGYSNIIGCQDPYQASRLYQEQDSDLILLDLNMPGKSGYEVMEQLKKETNSSELPPILVLTAQGYQDSRQKALDSGARDYVTKPFHINELLSRVRNLLEVLMANKYMRHQNELLEKEVQLRTVALHDSRLQIVRRLGRAAEYRDNETGLHIIRMSKMAALIGSAAGMSDSETDLLLNAAPMHDIGKIGIPDHILLKPGKLDIDEFKIMKTHTQIGADILSGDDSELLLMAKKIALSHHEKWDGSGYPANLKGKEIPLEGRVTALADVFDALTSKRPYKNAWTVEDSVSLIKEQSGKHFEPSLVNIFIEQLPNIVAIKSQHAEPEEIKVSTDSQNLQLKSG